MNPSPDRLFPAWKSLTVHQPTYDNFCYWRSRLMNDIREMIDENPRDTLMWTQVSSLIALARREPGTKEWVITIGVSDHEDYPA